MSQPITTLTIVLTVLACIVTVENNAVCQQSNAQVQANDSSSRIPRSDESTKWIRQLKSLQYRQRVEASERLVSYGKLAIQPLFEAISSNDLETSFRAIKIIKEIGLNSDLDTLELIIIRSNQLPSAFQDQFKEWSSQAISKWKSNQSKIAIGKLVEKGATVQEVDALDELGFMLIEDLEDRVKPLKEKAKTGTATVLEQIANLKKEMSGEVVAEKPRKNEDESAPEKKEVVELTGRGLIVRGGMIARPVDPLLNPQNVTIDSSWKGKPRDLNHLRFVSNLNQIEFVEFEITAEMLAELKKIRKLRSVLLTRCKFSFSDVRSFKKEKDKFHPLQLMATGAGYLGVYGPNAGEPDDGKGSYISLVSPNSAASDAGLERGDVIIRVDEDPIRSFADLSLVISSKPVGKEIKISIRRREKEKVVTAKLKSRVGLR